VNLFAAAVVEVQHALSAAQPDSRVAWAMRYDANFAGRLVFACLARCARVLFVESRETSALLDRGVEGVNALVLGIAQGAIRDAIEGALADAARTGAQA
jgi:hypothetical protein